MSFHDSLVQTNSQNREIENLLYSGLTTWQLEVILSNALSKNFTVNLFGYYHGAVYPIHIGICASRNSEKTLEKKALNLFKIGLHVGDVRVGASASEISENLNKWSAEGNSVINRVESEKKIQEALEKTETEEMKYIRKKCKEQYNFIPPFEREKKKSFTRWKHELRSDEAKEVEMFYFNIENLDNFLMQYYVSPKTGHYIARQAKFCPRCITAFFSENSLENHKKMCTAKTDYYKEVLPSSIGSIPTRSFDKPFAKERNPVCLYADFEALLQVRLKYLYWCIFTFENLKIIFLYFI